MSSRILFLLCLPMAWSSMARADAAADFTRLAQQSSRVLSTMGPVEVGGQSVDTGSLANALASARFELRGSDLQVNGATVDLRNTPVFHEIEAKAADFVALWKNYPDMRRQMVIHEGLGLAGIPDTEYRVSQELADRVDIASFRRKVQILKSQPGELGEVCKPGAWNRAELETLCQAAPVRKGSAMDRLRDGVYVSDPSVCPMDVRRDLSAREITLTPAGGQGCFGYGKAIVAHCVDDLGTGCAMPGTEDVLSVKSDGSFQISRRNWIISPPAGWSQAQVRANLISELASQGLANPRVRVSSEGPRLFRSELLLEFRRSGGGAL